MEKILYEFLGTFGILGASAYYKNTTVTVIAIVIAKFLTKGNLNPAVTLLDYLAGDIDIITLSLYIMSQLTASFVAYFLFYP